MYGNSYKNKVQLGLMGMSLLLLVIGYKPKFETNRNLELIMVVDEKSGDHQC